MFLSPLIFLASLPFVTASGVYKLKLQKIPSVASNPDLESAYLAEKYGVLSQARSPLIGAGGSGRRVQRPNTRNAEQRSWTQDEIKSHRAPLTS